MSAAPDLLVLASRAFGADGADSVVVADGRIAAVATRCDAMAARGPRTRVVDAPRGIVCAGFHDAHAHLAALALARREVDLHGLDLAGIVDAMRAAAAARPADRWLVGRGFDPEVFRLGDRTARAALDAAAPGTPLLLRSHDYHSAAMNTLGMLTAGFLPRPPEIDGGSFDRDAAGAPTGIVREMAAIRASAYAEDLSGAELAGAVASVFSELHRAGVTAVHEMSGSRVHPALRSLDESGRLGVDVYATVSPGDAGVAELRAPGRAFHVVGMKTFLDGALGSRTAHLLAPYEGDAAHRGVEVLPREETRRLVAETAAAGLPSYLHAIGDAAVRAALDALEAAPGFRHRVEHAQMVHDDDLPRFARAGIVASMQPVHMALDAPIVHRHWGARSREAFPTRRLLDSGAIVAFGSDAPIETCDALAGIRCATSRRGRDGTALSPEEAVSPAEAIAAYTRGAAAAVSRENATGALRVGDAANVTLLTEDVVARPESLADCAVAATIVRGEVVFARRVNVSDVVPAHQARPRPLHENKYVYVVLSRRAGGVSIGVNLSPHKGCNFDCTYCQVDRKTPATVKTVDVDVLRAEVRDVFAAAKSGALYAEPRFAAVAKEKLVLADVAFAGDGEPTNEPWFADSARVVAEEKERAGFAALPIRVITNATVFHKPKVAETLRFLDAHALDVWAKLDAGTEAYYRAVDRTDVPFQRVLDNLLLCARARPTTIQSLFARHHGEAPSAAEIAAYADRLRALRAGGAQIPWVQIHTVSRPPAESYVQPLTMEELETIAAAARAALPDARVVAYRGAA